MSQTITLKLKILHDATELNTLNMFCLKYRDGLNLASKLAFENEKTSNKIKIQKLSYIQVRGLGVGSQLACSIARDVGAKYKAQWTKLKKHKENIEKGYTKRHYKGLDVPIQFKSRTCTLQYKKDFSFDFQKELVSIPTLKGRIKLSFKGWDKHIELLKSVDTKIGASQLWYSKTKKQYYLCVSVTIPTEEVDLSKLDTVIGVDLGQRYLATTQSNKGKVKFFSGKQVKHKSNQFALKRKELQAKGTRSATRKLVKLSMRERLFKQSVNHSLSKIILQPNSLIGLEELSQIQERTNKFRRGKRASVKQRQANSNRSKWAFAELGNYLTYKAKLNNCGVIKIDADYTSKGCPVCGYIDIKNRPNKGLNFICQCCGHQDHADRIGAKNILMRTTLARQCLVSGGTLSKYLNVTSDEAKAERLKAFLELRWS